MRPRGQATTAGKDGLAERIHYSDDEREEMDKLKSKTNSVFQKLAKRHQKGITELLGRLEETYDVGVSVPSFDPDYLPFDITLGEKDLHVPLDEWGSGTRNRTLILMAMFRAKKISDSAPMASRVTPILVIEEPESFLHPSAQAEFGRVLQALAEEFKVQVLATTHSPYMLSQANPASNILLKRCTDRNHIRETISILTDGDNWMEPFGLALGIDNREFEPWKNLFFNSQGSKILLVEGDTDRDYFLLLQDAAHGRNQLKFDGEIFPYGGKDTLKNSVLLRFIKNKYNNVFVIFDLDAESHVMSSLNALGLKKNHDYLAIGLNASGKDSIEGLLPDSVRGAVYGRQPDLVQQALGTGKDRGDAKNRLKRYLYDEFKSVAVPGEEFFGHFYGIVRHINKAFA